MTGHEPPVTNQRPSHHIDGSLTRRTFDDAEGLLTSHVEYGGGYFHASCKDIVYTPDVPLGLKTRQVWGSSELNRGSSC